jgi:charged multivesicular body protein 1
MSNRQMARDMQVEFQARFQAKQARREAQKAAKQDPVLKKQIQELLKKGETQKAYQKAKILLSKQALAQQMDQVADMAELQSSQIQANNAMNRMTHMMGQSSRVMNVAQKNSNPEKVIHSYYFSLCFYLISWTNV